MNVLALRALMRTIFNARGFFGIGIYHPKFEENIGTLWRHAYLYNASFVFIIGGRYKRQATDTSCATKHIPLYCYDSWEDFKSNLPVNAELIAIELDDNSQCLSIFKHPLNAVYLLGSEGYGLPQEVLNDCDATVELFSLKPQSMNVATTGTIVMYDRIIKLKGNNDQ